jgi:hypothetical protein
MHNRVESDVPFYPRPREMDESLLGDLTGGRPGAIIETEEQLALKAQIISELDQRTVDKDMLKDYGERQVLDEEDMEDGDDDPDALDASTLGTVTIQDLRSQFDYEWDPQSGTPDPNRLALEEAGDLLPSNPKDDDGVEIGYDPIFGPSNPLDIRTVLGTKDSYVIDPATKDDLHDTAQFPPGDPEISFNEDFVSFRKSLDIIETFMDPFLQQEVPRHVAKWHGYPEQMHFEPKDFYHNRFTDNPTDFNTMTPFRARQRAVEMARAKNAEWLPVEVPYSWHQAQRAPYEKYSTLMGTLRKGECDPTRVEQIQPALRILGSCVDLLSIEGEDMSIYRFAYHGFMKNKFGMQCWTHTLIEDCGVPVANVVFETGFRKRDRLHDGGEDWNGPTF